MTSRRIDKAGLVIALCLLLLAAVVFLDTGQMQLSAVYGVGPKAMLYVVGTGLAVLAVGNAVVALRGDAPERESVDMTAILWIVGGLVGLIAIIGLGGGFIPATAILFAAVSAGFGRRAFFVDLAIGFGLAVVVFLVFSKLLSLTLPVGPLERLL